MTCPRPVHLRRDIIPLCMISSSFRISYRWHTLQITITIYFVLVIILQSRAYVFAQRLASCTEEARRNKTSTLTLLVLFGGALALRLPQLLYNKYRVDFTSPGGSTGLQLPNGTRSSAPSTECKLYPAPSLLHFCTVFSLTSDVI